MDLGYNVKAAFLPGVVTLTRGENVIHLNYTSIEQFKMLRMCSNPSDEQVLLNSGVRVSYGGSGCFMLQVPDNAIMLTCEQITKIFKAFKRRI